ncbi:hypothetical protein GQX74_013432 [Glossina fuscipes]|nr:hypothetical protein GQX74_013432 [Glossina fuscipes]
MISKKDQLLNQPWQQQRYMKHKNKVNAAVALIDHSPPPQYQHVKDKLKKFQAERERISLINAENVRLLQKLTEIMQAKRMPDLWTEPRPNYRAKNGGNVAKHVARPVEAQGVKKVVVKVETRSLNGDIN